jgi:chorismate mutase/prephenate dehydratase
MSQGTSQKPYSSPELDRIRQRIDTLDTTIHNALMERADLVLKIGEEKKKNNIQIVQPAREARMIRRLLERHEGVLPEKAIVRIWRELVGAVSLLQTGLKVAVSAPEGNRDLWDLARDYFGSCLPFMESASALSALAAVREERANFAVVPWPEDDDTNPWWLQLEEDGENALQIIVRLPHVDGQHGDRPDLKGLIVARTGFDTSDEDRTFLLVSCEPTISRAKLLDEAKKAGLEPLGLSSCKSLTDAPSRHLLEVDGYVEGESPVLPALSAGLGEGARIYVAGGYPVPPRYK